MCPYHRGWFPLSRLTLSFIQKQQSVHPLQSKSEAKLSRAFQALWEHRSEQPGILAGPGPAREVQQVLQDPAGQAHVQHTKQITPTISSCRFMALSKALHRAVPRLLSNSNFLAGLLEKNTTWYVWFSRIPTTKSGREKPQQALSCSKYDSREVYKIAREALLKSDLPGGTLKKEKEGLCTTLQIQHSRSARARTKRTKRVHDRPRFSRKRPT